jgi:PAS domain S-box-containing protein
VFGAERGPTTIVVVDDVAELRALVGTRLRLSGRFVVVGEAGTAADAVALARAYRPDAVLLDVAMPGGSGLDVLAEIRAVSPGTKLVVYSGVPDEDLPARARQLGAVGFIPKTAPFGELIDRVSAALSRTPAGPEPAAESKAGGATTLDSPELYRLLVERVVDYGIFMLDPEGRIASWNLGAQRIKGYTADEAIGRHFRMFYTPEAQASGHPEHELELVRRDGRYEEEGWRVRKDGSRFWASVTITALRHPSGTLVGYAKVTRDITERREMLNRLERSAADLAAANARLADANARLAEANVDLARSAEDKSQFLAVTAHELRTPIRVMTGAADTLSEYWAALSEEERAGLLESLRSSGGRMRRLLEDLLTAARLESGAIEVRLAPTLVRPLLLDAVAETLATYPDLRVEVDCDPALAVRADPSRLGQIMTNYLTNAARYGAAPVRVEVATRSGEVVIEVCDRGPGVPADLERRLFEKFARGAEDRGTGLGLFIVRQLARAQGGDAWYERRGDASCFGLRLSTADATADREPVGAT